MLTKTLLTVIVALMANAALADAAPRAYPQAFPEEGRRAPRKDATSPPAPVAVPPGAPASEHPILHVPQPPPDNAEWLLRRMAESDHPEARRRASEMWPVSEEVLDDLGVLVHALADPDVRVRDGAALRMRALPPAEVFGFVMRTLVGGDADQVRALDAALPALGDLLESYMLETLRTEIETAQHRRIAAYCLGRMGARRAIDTLAEHAWGDELLVARACVDALFAIAAPAAETYWWDILEHPEPYFRQQAVRALAVIGGPNSFARLRRIVLGEGDEGMQTTAFNVIADWPPEHLFPLLVEMLEANAPLRGRALRLLRGRTGLELGARSDEWRAWVDAFLAGPPPPPIMPAP